VLLYLCAEPLLGLFTADPVVRAQCRELLYLTIFVQPLMSLNTVLFHSLKTFGSVVGPVVATQLMMWCISVPLAWHLAVGAGLGVVGLWYVLVLEEALKALVMLVLWSRCAAPSTAGGRPAVLPA
jgi:Na+-driven multidrug efflux pump